MTILDAIAILNSRRALTPKAFFSIEYRVLIHQNGDQSGWCVLFSPESLAKPMIFRGDTLRATVDLALATIDQPKTDAVDGIAEASSILAQDDPLAIEPPASGPEV